MQYLKIMTYLQESFDLFLGFVILQFIVKSVVKLILNYIVEFFVKFIIAEFFCHT